MATKKKDNEPTMEEILDFLKIPSGYMRITSVVIGESPNFLRFSCIPQKEKYTTVKSLAYKQLESGVLSIFVEQEKGNGFFTIDARDLNFYYVDNKLNELHVTVIPYSNNTNKKCHCE